jgi:hypothetical protein
VVSLGNSHILCYFRMIYPHVLTTLRSRPRKSCGAGHVPVLVVNLNPFHVATYYHHLLLQPLGIGACRNPFLQHKDNDDWTVRLGVLR